MAGSKRAKLEILQPTEQTATDLLAEHDQYELPATGRTMPTGVGLKESEHAALTAIANEKGLAVNAIARFAIRDFIIRYRRGQIDLSDRIVKPITPRNRLRM